jgi:pantothenate kinase type III
MEVGMKALIADAGNTRVAFAGWTAADGLPCRRNGVWLPARPLRALASLPTPRDAAADAVFVEAVHAMVDAAGGVPLVLVSVVPRVDALLAAMGLDLRPVDHTSPLPFGHRLREPAATGADRLCNVAAAVAAGLEAALIVDAGTATTCDVLVGGVFEGGLIAPGMAFALEQIGRQAARLRPLPFAETPLVAGQDTASALAAGSFHAGVGGVEALISGLQRVHGPLPVVVTGGLARFLARPDRFLDSQWTLRGAACLAGLS